MGFTHARYQATREARFRELIGGWLATLPKSGWRGTAAALTEALDAHAEATWGYPYAFVPTSSGLSKTLMFHEPAINAAGWTLAFRKSNGRRLIEFTRAVRKKHTNA